jgi:hypothetical protein
MPLRRTAYLTFLALLFLGTTSVYAKGGAADPYDAAREAEGRLDYKAVLRNASTALESAQSHDRLVNLYQMLGTACALLGKSGEAVDAFTKLLAIDPDRKLPRGTSPKIAKPFQEAGGYWVDRPGGLQLSPTLPREINAGKALSVPIKLDDPLNMAVGVRTSYRAQGDVEFKNIETAISPAMTVTIPPEQIPSKPNDYVFELFFTAVSSNGSELRQAGTAANPLSIAVRSLASDNAIVTTTTSGGTVVTGGPVKPKKPLIKQWWFWTAIGAVIVVGAAVGGGVGWYYTKPDTSHTDITLSSRTLMMQP